MDSWPHQFSGGMRQRVMLAMGFANEPSLILADEPTTALDVTIQAQILDLLRALNADLGTAVILISHDLGVIATICSRVLVMYAGEVVEEGRPQDLLTDPRHPYTWALLHAAPRLDGDAGDRRLATIEGQPPDARAWPEGCRFRARCPFAIDACAQHPELLPIGHNRSARCWVTQGGVPLHPPPPRAAANVPPTSPGATPAPLLHVQGLVKHFLLPRENFLEPHRVLRAVDGVDLDVFPRRDRRPGGRIRLRQVDLGAPGDAAGGADRGAHRVRRPGHLARVAVRHPAVAPADADDLPGPVCLAQSAHDGGRDPGRAAAPARTGGRRGGGARAGWRIAQSWSACRRTLRHGSRTNSPAGSASAFRSPARWRSSRCSWWATNRFRRWT